MKTPLLLVSAIATFCALMSACKEKSGARVAPGEPSPDGYNTSSSGVVKDEKPPSTSSGHKGTGAGTDAPDDPSKANPPAVRQPTSEPTPAPPPPQR